MSVSPLSIAAFETEALPRRKGVVDTRVARWVKSTACTVPLRSDARTAILPLREKT